MLAWKRFFAASIPSVSSTLFDDSLAMNMWDGLGGMQASSLV
jgi:hypothetical protein